MVDAVRKVTSLLLFSFFLLPCLMNDSVGLEAKIVPGKGPWCVANSIATKEALEANIQYVCLGLIGVCREIKRDGSCYSTDIVKQASYAMDAYFYVMGPEYNNCYFNGTGIIVHEDPSYGNCIYPSPHDAL